MSLGNRHSQHSFAQIPSVNHARSQFDRSFGIKDTIGFDALYPIFVDEVLPGDTSNVTMNVFARLATQVVPVMDNMYIDYFFFFVPNRLVWDNWEKFCGAQDNPGDSTDYLLPSLTFTSPPLVGTIFDKMGLPVNVNYKLNNTLPLRAYALIWNEWFRDQNLQTRVDVPKDDGPDAQTDFSLRYRGKRHDYFTSALPWPQKGPAVSLDLTGTAPVVTNGQNVTLNPGDASNRNWRVSSAGNSMYLSGTAVGADASLKFGNQSGLQVNADAGSIGATINALREAFAMQALFELDARGGTRYVELLRAHFGVISPDYRIQRPEYLGGGQTTINAHPVASTAETADLPQANLASFATSSSSGQNIGFTKSFDEHGYVIGLAAARADLTYQQGLNRMWNRSTRYDFYWPKLAELGEQAILSKELYLDGTAGDETVFGYQERYAEYRYKPSEIHGAFRSDATAPLDQWHLAQDFLTRPTLNNSFIISDTPWQRFATVTTEPPILIDIYYRYKHARPMPVYSVPATLGRF